MLHGSETWPVRKENEVALQRAELRMVRWMCGVKLQDRVPEVQLSLSSKIHYLSISVCIITLPSIFCMCTHRLVFFT